MQFLVDNNCTIRNLYRNKNIKKFISGISAAEKFFSGTYKL